MTDRTRQLFVYGSLMPGHRFFPRIENHVHDCRPGSIQGVLLDLGAYPALVEGHGLVKGMLLEIDEEALEITDWIEGYSPDEKNCLYIRREVIVTLDIGEQQMAWTYFFADRESISDRQQLIVDNIEGVQIFAWLGNS